MREREYVCMCVEKEWTGRDECVRCECVGCMKLERKMIQQQRIRRQRQEEDKVFRWSADARNEDIHIHTHI